MIDKPTEELLGEVIWWFEAQCADGWDIYNDIRIFDVLIRKLCGGEPHYATLLLQSDGPDGAANPPYLTQAIWLLDNQHGGIRDISTSDMLRDWYGEAATQFKGYNSFMANALDDCLAIAEGIRAIMMSYQALV